MRKIVNIIITLIPISFYFIFLGNISGDVAIHYNFAGEIDQYGSKLIYLGLAFIPLILLILSTVMIKLDKIKAPNLQISKRIITYILGFMSFVMCTIIYQTSYIDFNGIKAIVFGFGVLFMLLGNGLNKLEPNKIVGIRTKATLSNNQTWYQTHRRAGYIFVIYGLLLIIFIPFFNNPKFILIGLLFDLTFIVGYLVIYSRQIYQKEKEIKE